MLSWAMPTPLRALEVLVGERPRRPLAPQLQLEGHLRAGVRVHDVVRDPSGEVLQLARTLLQHARVLRHEHVVAADLAVDDHAGEQRDQPAEETQRDAEPLASDAHRLDGLRQARAVLGIELDVP
jgi:hypothetical protein